MNSTGPIIYTVAEPTRGLFPTEQIAEAFKASLLRVEKIIPDWPQSVRDRLTAEIDHRTPRGYGMLVAETYRHQREAGQTSIMDIEGITYTGARLLFRLAEKFVSVAFPNPTELKDEDEIRQVIPKVKELIAGVFPDVQFKDVYSRK